MEFAYQNQSILDWRVGENRAIVTSDIVETYSVEEGEKRNGSIWENKVSLDQDEKSWAWGGGVENQCAYCLVLHIPKASVFRSRAIVQYTQK